MTDLPSTGPSILIVSDCEPITERLRDSYRRNGHRLHITDDAVAALDTLDADPSIGVVVVRHAPPQCDGLALIQRIRTSRHGRACEFIVVAENPSADEVVRAMHMQIADVVNDPADGARLHGALVRALSKFQAEPAHPAFQTDRQQILDEAYRHGLALIAAVRSLRQEQTAPGPGAIPTMSAARRPTAVKPVPVEDAKPQARQLEMLRSIQRARTARDRLFPKGLFEDPCWDMLLDLMINDTLGKRISVSSLCVASGVAQTTALRRITDLHARGLVRRVADERDGRRIFVELTEQGREAMSRYFDHIERMG